MDKYILIKDSEDSVSVSYIYYGDVLSGLRSTKKFGKRSKYHASLKELIERLKKTNS